MSHLAFRIFRIFNDEPTPPFHFWELKNGRAKKVASLGDPRVAVPFSFSFLQQTQGCGWVMKV